MEASEQAVHPWTVRISQGFVPKVVKILVELVDSRQRHQEGLQALRKVAEVSLLLLEASVLRTSYLLSSFRTFTLMTVLYITLHGVPFTSGCIYQ